MNTSITLSMYGLYIVTFVLGQVLTIMWWDIPQIRQLAAAANHSFDPKEYWKKSWNVHIGLEVLGTIVFLVLDQIIHWKPQLLTMMWWMSPVFGMMGTAIASRFGTYRKFFLNILDKKANLLDYGTIDKPAPIPPTLPKQSE